MKRKLREGKAKLLLESSIEAALLSVEIYNKPRCKYKVEGYITNMIMAWTKLLLAHFHIEIGDRYYYKGKNGKFMIVDGEKKVWCLKDCIKKYKNLSTSVTANLNMFIGLRNKIEHSIIDKNGIDVKIFGECQSLLYNYENELIKLFGDEYALNENLAFSLQFSKTRTPEQKLARKEIMSRETKDIIGYIEKFKDSMAYDTFNSQEYSIKLLQIPKIANNDRNALAVEFVHFSEDDKESYNKITTLVKDKVVRIEAVNAGKLKPSQVVVEVNEKIKHKITMHDHTCLSAIFGIRIHKGFPDLRNK